MRTLLPLTLSLLGAVVAAQTAGAPSPCTIELSVGDTAEEAAVSSTSPAAVLFFGNYTVSMPPLAERAVVSLVSTVDTGWVSTVSPSSVTISGNVRMGPFTVTVVAPAGALPEEVGLATVAATMVVVGLQCEDTLEGLSITPLPYFDGFTGRIDPQNVTLRSGAGSFTLLIGAKANVPVSISIEYSGPEGVTFSGPSSVALPGPGSGPMEVNVTVRISAGGLAAGSYQLEILVRGTTAEGLTHQGQLLAPLEVPLPGDPLQGAPWAVIGGAAAVGVACVGAYGWRRQRGR